MDNEAVEILHEHADDVDVKDEVREAEADHGMETGDMNTIQDHKDPGHDGRHRYGKLNEHHHDKH